MVWVYFLIWTKQTGHITGEDGLIILYGDTNVQQLETQGLITGLNGLNFDFGDTNVQALNIAGRWLDKQGNRDYALVSSFIFDLSVYQSQGISRASMVWTSIALLKFSSLPLLGGLLPWMA